MSIPSLSRAANFEAFAKNPIGRFHGGETWMHWCASPVIWGVQLWDRLGRGDAAGLIHSLRLELLPTTTEHVSLVDASGASGVDSVAFELLSAYVKEESATLKDKVQRLALVRPEGMVGALAAGFYEILDAPYPVKLFDTVVESADWLGYSNGAKLVAELDAAQQSLLDQAPIVSLLHAQLRSNLEMSSKEAARALAVSERTLQRRLAEVNTNFQSELRAVRIEASKAMMRDSDAPLTEIALDCGFRSLQNFSAAFRREVGEAPSTWRQTSIGAQP